MIKVIQKVGDRDNPSISIKDYAFCLNANPMSDRQQFVVLYDEPNIDVRAVGRQRTEEEKRRRHIYGDKGAKFSQGKQMCLLGDILGTLTTLPSKDNLICEIYEC